MKPYEQFMVGLNSTILYFDEIGNLYKLDGTMVSDSLRQAILAHPEIMRRIA